MRDGASHEGHSDVSDPVFLEEPLTVRLMSLSQSSNKKYTFRVAAPRLFATLWTGVKLGIGLLAVELCLVSSYLESTDSGWEGGPLFWIGLVMPFVLAMIIRRRARLDVCARLLCLARLPLAADRCPGCRALICGRIGGLRDYFEARKIIEARLAQLLSENVSVPESPRVELPEARILRR